MADTQKQPLLTHLAELRTRLLWSFLAMAVCSFISYHFAQDIYGFLVKPLAAAMGPEDTQRLIYTDLTEAFFTYVKIAFFGGAFLAFPVMVMQIWLFISPGLFPTEKKAIIPFLVASPVLFIMGAALVYYLILPLAWTFFLSFQSSGDETVLPVMLEARVGEYLDLTMMLIFAFGICFQLPIITALLARAGVVDAQMLASKRRYAVVGMFVVAAIVTPPDAISQISLALPLWALYEISILVIKRMKVSHVRHTT